MGGLGWGAGHHSEEVRGHVWAWVCVSHFPLPFPSESSNYVSWKDRRGRGRHTHTPTCLLLKISSTALLFLRGTCICAMAKQCREIFMPSPGLRQACPGCHHVQLHQESMCSTIKAYPGPGGVGKTSNCRRVNCESSDLEECSLGKRQATEGHWALLHAPDDNYKKEAGCNP